MAIFQRKQAHYDLYYSIREGIDQNSETIVFIHGLGFSSEIWESMIKKVDPSHRIIVYDLAGHNKSGVYNQELTWDFYCQELFDLLDHLQIDCCHLVGHGFGGIIGMKAVVDNERCFKSLTLISTPLYFPEDLFKYEYDVRFDLLERRRSSFGYEMTLNAIHNVTADNKRILESAFRMIDERTYIDTVRLVFASSDGFMNDLQNITLPTLVMGGELDPVFPVNYTAIYSSYLSNSRLRIIPNASNAAFMDDPDYAASSLNSFIEERDRLYFSKSHAYLMHKINNILEKGRLVEQEEATLHIKAVNTFSIQWKKQRIDGKWNQRFAKELLLYLTLKQRVTREELIDAFLPDYEPTKARNYLRVMLNHLKHTLEAFPDPQLVEALSIDRQFVMFDIPVNVDLKNFIDSVDHFEKLPAVRQFDTLLHLIRQFKQSFMPGFDAPWISSLKMMLEQRLGHFMTEVAEAYDRAGDEESAILLLMEGTCVEPYDGYCNEKIEEIKQPYHRVNLVGPPIG